MAVKIRLKRLGKVRVPQYRIVVVDSRKKRDGRVLEEIGKYHPKENPSLVQVESERAQYWLGVGAQPSDAVHKILRLTGDWQAFKGLPGSEGRVKSPEAKRDKTEAFNEALKEVAGEPRAGAVTRPKKGEKKTDKKAEKQAEKPAESAEQAETGPETAPETAQSAEVPAATEVPGVETPEGAEEEAVAQETAATKSNADPARPDADKRAEKTEG